MDDGNDTLYARASYTDGFAADSAVGASVNPVLTDTRNKAPVFLDQDTETDGDQLDQERSVAENAATNDPVGSPVTATDASGDTLTYTLGGADSALFAIDRGLGQISVKSGTKLDKETQDTYTVTVTATDSFGISSTITVTIKVTNVDEAPVISVGGLVVTGPSSIDYAEDRTGMVATYSAAGPDAARATWSLEGDDAGDFRISNAGVLTFRTTPNYEAPADAGTDNVYQVTVEANDGTNTATKAVTVIVTDVDEMVTGDALVDEYDADGSGMIEKSEVLKAINDYLFGEGDEAISKPEVLRLINIYLFG